MHDSTYRVYGTTPEMATACAVAFCERIEEARYLDFIDRFEEDPAEALQPVCAPFTQPEDYSWRIHVEAFYATFFSVRAKAFDAEYCCAGKDAVKRKIREIENNKDATAVEQNLLTTLEVCYEFYLRGFHFDTINIYESDATKFKVTENGLLPPFTTVHGLGEAAAIDTVEKRNGKEFVSVEEFAMCCNKLSKTHIEQLKALGAFAGMAETSQLTLF